MGCSVFALLIQNMIGVKELNSINSLNIAWPRLKQPWLIFAAHRVLGYSSDKYYGLEGTFAEPMARESLQHLWQKYKVDLAFYGHVHNYERSCPVYEVNFFFLIYDLHE